MINDYHVNIISCYYPALYHILSHVITINKVYKNVLEVKFLHDFLHVYLGHYNKASHIKLEFSDRK